VNADEVPEWLSADSAGVIIRLYIAPRARRDEVQGVHGSALKVRLTAPPVEGAANRALIEFLAGRLGVRRQQIIIMVGQHARDKVVHVSGVTIDQALARLLAVASVSS
jgi:uncharacterized protein (TIGR00251 family)